MLVAPTPAAKNRISVNKTNKTIIYRDGDDTVDLLNLQTNTLSQ